MKLLGFSFRLGVVIASLIAGAVLGCHVLCSCANKPLIKKKVKEGMEVMGAMLGYNMSVGVPGAYGDRHLPTYAQNLQAYPGPQVPLPPGQLFFFANNRFTPECCVPPFSNVSSSDGCACVTKEQVDYINARGGNRAAWP